jgi:protein-tyrosine phosphatase
LRLSSHPAVRDVCSGLAQPVLLSPCPPSPSENWLRELGDAAAVLREPTAGPARRATTVFTNGRTWRVLEEGEFGGDEIDGAAACWIVFVCTGNTCRSPLAAALCKKLLAERLGCTPKDLPRHGFVVESAGLAASEGREATPEAVAVAGQLGADLSGHLSQPVSAAMLTHADFVVTMTYTHLRLLAGMGGAVLPRLLSTADEDIDDPIGGSPEIYESCARQIEREMLRWIPEFLEG